MSQAQDAMLGNLPNGIVTTLASHYVTNVMNADPETKLGYGQNAPLGSRPSRLVTCFVYLTLAMDHSRVSFLYAPVDDKPKNSVETIAINHACDGPITNPHPHVVFDRQKIERLSYLE